LSYSPARHWDAIGTVTTPTLFDQTLL